MGKSIHINATFGSNQTIGELGKIIQQRMVYMGESARDSVAACAITALTSIRTQTKVAKPSKIKPQVVLDNTIVASFTRLKNGTPDRCLRINGSNQRYNGPEKVVFASPYVKGVIFKVFRYHDENAKKTKDYLIVATDQSSAKAKAKQIQVRRAMTYSGLARRAMSFLMMKTVTKKKVVDNVGINVSLKADENTMKSENVQPAKEGKGKYCLLLVDTLRYALDAIKGGKATVDTQLKKAMNKIVSTMNRKISKKFGAKLETPFPEVRQRKTR